MALASIVPFLLVISQTASAARLEQSAATACSSEQVQGCAQASESETEALISFLQTDLALAGKSRTTREWDAKLGAGFGTAKHYTGIASKMLFLFTSRNDTAVSPEDCNNGVVSAACIIPLRYSLVVFMQWLIVLLLTIWAMQGFPGLLSIPDLFQSWWNQLHTTFPKELGSDFVAEPAAEALMNSAGGRRLPSSSTIPELVEEHSECWPEVPFLQIWEPGSKEVMTFRQFSEQVQAVSVILNLEGINIGMHVGILAQGNKTYHLFLLGCMRLGAVPVLLSWRQPVKHLVSMAKVASCSMLIISEHYAEQAAALQLGLSMLGPPLVLERMISQGSRQQPMAALKSSDCAVVLFTSGSTSTPKAVPHDHASLLWNCSNILVAKASAFPPQLGGGAKGGTVCFLPNFHAIGLTVNFLFNLYAGVRCAVLANPYTTPVTPELLLQACDHLHPSVLSTVPWIIEAFCNMFKAGDSSTNCLQELHHIAFAGAQLPSSCAAVLVKHNIMAEVSFGQTELGGPLLMGQVGGDLECMRPVPGVKYVLRAPGSTTGSLMQGTLTKGELVLYGAQSATHNYLPGSNGRQLCPAGSDTRMEYWTGDIFEEVIMSDGKVWLRHCSRDDDLLVHTSGEMTNPIPTEHTLVGLSAVHAACVLGDKCPRSVLVLELEADASHRKPAGDLANELWSKVQEANGAQPEWSAILPQHVVCLWRGKDEGMPVSVKGNVQRQVLHKRMEATLSFLLSDGPPPDENSVKAATWLKDNLPESDESDESRFDSLSMGKQEMRIDAQQGYFYLFCIVGVVLNHFWAKSAKNVHPEQPRLFDLMDNTDRVLTSMTLQGFTLLSGFLDLQKAPTWYSVAQLAVMTISGEFFRYVTNSCPYMEIVDNTYPQLWFLYSLLWMKVLFLATERITSPPARAVFRIMLGLLVNFGSSCGGSWPFFYRKPPYQIRPEWCVGLHYIPEDIDYWLIIHANNKGNHLFVFYFTLSYVFQHVKAKLSATSFRRAACLLVAVLLTIYEAFYFQGFLDQSWEGYETLEFLDSRWLAGAWIDLKQKTIQFVLVTCIFAALPKTPSWLSDAGGNSLMIYYLNHDLVFVFLPFLTFMNAMTVRIFAWAPADVTLLASWISAMLVYVFITCLLGITLFIPLERYTASALFMLVVFVQYYFFNWLLFGPLGL